MEGRKKRVLGVKSRGDINALNINLKQRQNIMVEQHLELSEFGTPLFLTL